MAVAVLIDEAIEVLRARRAQRNDKFPRDTPGVNCREARIELSANHVLGPLRYILGLKFAPAQNLD